MNKICFVVCYFGKWPKWFDAYLESCKYNPSIDFLFFTDCGKPENNYSNIKFIEYTINDFHELNYQNAAFINSNPDEMAYTENATTKDH